MSNARGVHIENSRMNGDYVVELYKSGKITLEEAAELSCVSLRRMLGILAEHRVKGNVKMIQQVNALDYAKSFINNLF